MFAKKLWVKFDENFDVVCWCDRKKCPLESKPECREFVVKFIEIERSKEVEEKVDATKRLEDRLRREAKKYETELKKSLRAMKKFKI